MSIAPLGAVQEELGLTFPVSVMEVPLFTVKLPVLVHPKSVVTVTEYVPGAFISMLEVVSPLLHRKLV